MALAENWATLWEAVAAASPQQVAVVLGDTEIKWGDLEQRAARLASGLAASSVGHDDHVAQMMYNCPEYLESAFAAFKVRASTVNVNFRYRAPEVAHVLGDSGAVALVFHGSFADVVAEARTSLPDLRLLVQVDDGSGAPLLDGAVAYETLVAEHQPAAPIERSGDDRLLLYTGGTTGLPKGVVWRHVDLFGALAFNGYASLGLPIPETPDEVGRVAAELRAAGSSPVNMTAPPLMHGTGLFLAMSTFLLGGTVVLLAGRRFDGAELLRLVQRERVTQLSIVGDAFARPIVAELQRAEAAGQPYDVSSLLRIVSTGATMSVDSKRELMARCAGRDGDGHDRRIRGWPVRDVHHCSWTRAARDRTLRRHTGAVRCSIRSRSNGSSRAADAVACLPRRGRCRPAITATPRRPRPPSGRSTACGGRSPATTR